MFGNITGFVEWMPQKIGECVQWKPQPFTFFAFRMWPEPVPVTIDEICVPSFVLVYMYLQE